MPSSLSHSACCRWGRSGWPPSGRDAGVDSAGSDYRQLLGNLLDWCTGKAGSAPSWPIETEAPRTVEVTLARNAHQLVVHFVNATGPEPLREVVPVAVGSTRVRLELGERCFSARRLLAGDAIPVAQDGQVVAFDLGQLGAYEAVTLDVVD